MSVIAKFRVDEISKSLHGKEEMTTIKLNPVYSNDPNSENAQFWKYTPSGSIVMGCVNPIASAQFELGKEYYIEFRKAE